MHITWGMLREADTLPFARGRAYPCTEPQKDQRIILQQKKDATCQAPPSFPPLLGLEKGPSRLRDGRLSVQGDLGYPQLLINEGDMWAHPQPDRMRPWPLLWLNLYNNLREVSGVWGSGTEDLDVLSPAGLQPLGLCQVLRDGRGSAGPSEHPPQAAPGSSLCVRGGGSDGDWLLAKPQSRKSP